MAKKKAKKKVTKKVIKKVTKVKTKKKAAKKAVKKKGGKNEIKKKKLKVVHSINGVPVATEEGNVEDFEISTSESVPEFNDNENQTGEFDDDTEEDFDDEPMNEEPI